MMTLGMAGKLPPPKAPVSIMARCAVGSVTHLLECGGAPVVERAVLAAPGRHCRVRAVSCLTASLVIAATARGMIQLRLGEEAGGVLSR